MTERIYKLQPDRTLSLRGFDTFAAAASIHSTGATGFSVSGTFRDPADFAVAVLYDADNFFEHPSIKYLPDTDFTGLTLSFNVNYSDALQPIDSPKFNWIDWATLDCILDDRDSTPAQVRLWDNATLVSGNFSAASATCNVQAATTGIRAGDRLTLWFENLAFDYTAPPGVSTIDLSFYAVGPTQNEIHVNGRPYIHVINRNPLLPGESSADQARALVDLMAGDPDVTATTEPDSNVVTLTVRPERTDIDIAVSATSYGSFNMRLTSPAAVATKMASYITGEDWIAANTTHALLAAASGTQITLTAARYGTVNFSGTSVTLETGTPFSGLQMGSFLQVAGMPYTVASVESPTALTLMAAPTGPSPALYVAPRGGRDGNLLAMYGTWTGSGLSLDRTQIPLSGGNSNVTWNCKIDLGAIHANPQPTGLPPGRIRQCWLTFAPSLIAGPYAAADWQAVFSNWQVLGGAAPLAVAGPGSVRIEENDSACAYTGKWSIESGFYSKYFAKATSDSNATVTITYTCQAAHDLYIGTSLYGDRAVAGIRLDTDTETSLDCHLRAGSAVVTRRRVRTAVAPGRHTLTIRLLEPGVFYFDFLEAAVVSDIPSALVARPGISPALDFDTDHTYKLPPARLMWIMDRLGYAGPMNEYLGVFWWNERVPVNQLLSNTQIDFTGSFARGDAVFLTLNGSALGKSIFPGDTPAIVANHFANWINGAFVGAWASATGPTLTISSRSAAPAYNLVVSVSATSTAGHAVISAQPRAGQYGTWLVDDSAPTPINFATREWHKDFYAQCAARGREVVTACSMELVNPPAGYAARFPDAARTPVSTATGFGALVSNHCAIGGSKLLAYQKAVYRNIAQLQTDAGLAPCVQYGEFLWWFESGPGGMAYYDDETLAAAAIALHGRPLHIFLTPNDDPSVNGGADVLFLRNRLRDHLSALVADIRSAFPTVKCELLWPYDVNHPTPVPPESPIVGGQLNRALNLPVEWQQKPTSGFDRIKVEALAFATSPSMRNLDLAKEAIDLFPGFGWPVDSLRYLVPVFGSATPWHRELALARSAGMKINNLWAFDHICLYNLDVPERALERRSIILAA